MADGIVIRNSKNVRMENNKIDVDGDAIVVDDSEEITAIGNIIGSSEKEITPTHIEEMKEIVSGLQDVNAETRQAVQLLLEQMKSQDKPAKSTTFQTALSLIGSVGSGLLVEYLKKKIGL